MTNSGQIRSSVVRTFSRTSRRAHSDAPVAPHPGGQVERRARRLAGIRVGRHKTDLLLQRTSEFDRHGGLLAAFLAGPGRARHLCYPQGKPAFPRPLAAGLLTRQSILGRVCPWIFPSPKNSAPFSRSRAHFARDEMMPHARDWDEGEVFPVETLRTGGGARLRRHLCQGRCRRLGADPARCRADFRGTGARLHLDRRLYLDPQHGGVDDRHLRQRGVRGRSFCPS